MAYILRLTAIMWALLTVCSVMALLFGALVVDAGSVQFFARSDGRLMSWQYDLTTGVRLQVGDYPDALLVSPDGEQAVFSEHDTTYDLIDYYLIAAGELRHLGTYSDGSRLNWSADGDVLLQTIRNPAQKRSAVYRIEPATGQRAAVGDYEWQPYRIDGSAGGQQIALVDILYNSRSIGTVMLLHPERDTPLLIDSTSGVDWSADGRWLAAIQAAQPPRHFAVIDPRTGEPHPNIPNEIGGWYYRWTPDGESIIFENRRGQMSRLTLADGQTRTLAEEGLRALQWSHSGRYEIRYQISAADTTTIMLYDHERERQHTLLTGIDSHSWRFYHAVWSSDETRFGLRLNSLTASHITLFDLETGAQLARLQAPAQRDYGFIQHMRFVD